MFSENSERIFSYFSADQNSPENNQGDPGNFDKQIEPGEFFNEYLLPVKAQNYR
jgi:hypothetical protein